MFKKLASKAAKAAVDKVLGDEDYSSDDDSNSSSLSSSSLSDDDSEDTPKKSYSREVARAPEVPSPTDRSVSSDHTVVCRTHARPTDARRSSCCYD